MSIQEKRAPTARQQGDAARSGASHRRALRSQIAAAVLAAVACSLSHVNAQDAPSQNDELRALVEHLELIQSANLALAQEIAGTLVSAAESIRTAVAAGAFAEEVEDRALAVAENSATLAVIVLAPIGTRAESQVDPFEDLLGQNIVQLDALMERSSDDRARSVLREVRANQVGAEAMFRRLEDSWTDYGDALRRAELTGTLAVGSFDPRSRRWAFPSSPLADAPETDAFATLPPLPNETSSDLAASPGGDAESAAGGSGQWVVSTDRNGLPAATAVNLDAASRARLSSITIGCNDDGTLKYEVDGDAALREIAIVFGETERAFVAVEQGAVVGGQALRMSDSLRLAHEWAASKRSATIEIGSPADQGLVAALPVANYYEARGAVLDSCEPHEMGASESAAIPETSEASAAPVPFPRPRDRMPSGS